MNQHLTKSQTCALLNCKSKKFYNLIADKTDPLPAYKLGDGPRAEWRIDPAMLEDWIKRHITSGIIESQVMPQPPVAAPHKGWEMIIPNKASLHC